MLIYQTEIHNNILVHFRITFRLQNSARVEDSFQSSRGYHVWQGKSTQPSDDNNDGGRTRRTDPLPHCPMSWSKAVFLATTQKGALMWSRTKEIKNEFLSHPEAKLVQSGNCLVEFI